MEKNFISMLLERKKFYTEHVFEENVDDLKSCSAIEEFVSRFLDTFPCRKFVIDNANDFQNSTLPEKLRIYLSSLHESMKFISDSDKSLTISHYCDDKNSSRMDIEKRMRIATSPYYPLVFSICNNKNDDHQTNDSPERKSDPTIFPLNAQYIAYKSLQYFDRLDHIAYALRNTIQFCPYCAYIKGLPVHRKEPDRKDDEEKDAPHDFDKYRNDSGEFIVNLNKSELPFNLFEPEVQSAILKLGGPFVIEYFRHAYDITYRNDEILNKNDIKKFFVKAYQSHIHYYDDIRKNQEIFDYFSFETIINGSFLMYFCNFFSLNNNKMVPKLKKLVPQNDYLTFLSDLYKEMNRIENPFLKCELLGKIIHPSFYNSYKYDNYFRSAGKENFSVWKNDLYEYISNLIDTEQKLYKIYIALASDSIERPKPELLIKEYRSLYEKSVIGPYSSCKRGIIQKELLPKITIANFEYYPLWQDFYNSTPS